MLIHGPRSCTNQYRLNQNENENWVDCHVGIYIRDLLYCKMCMHKHSKRNEVVGMENKRK